MNCLFKAAQQSTAAEQSNSGEGMLPCQALEVSGHAQTLGLVYPWNGSQRSSWLCHRSPNDSLHIARRRHWALLAL